MTTISIDEMQRDLAGALHRVQAGETLVVTQHDRPVAEIKPIAGIQGASADTPRPFGLCAGEFTVPGDFDAPLPDDVLRDFEAAAAFSHL